MHNVNTLITLARAIGFEVQSLKFMSLLMMDGKCSAVECNVANADYVGMVLRKPQANDGRLLRVEDLDHELVTNCQESKARMEKFIETKLEFVEAYPFVRERVTPLKKT